MRYHCRYFKTRILISIYLPACLSFTSCSYFMPQTIRHISDVEGYVSRITEALEAHGLEDVVFEEMHRSDEDVYQYGYSDYFFGMHSGRKTTIELDEYTTLFLAIAKMDEDLTSYTACLTKWGNGMKTGTLR